MKLFAPLAFALALAACGDGADRPTVDLPGAATSADGAAAGARPNAPVPTSPATEPLTAYGRDPVRVGMASRDALAVLGLEAGAATDACSVVEPADGPPGLAVMIESGRVVRVSAYGVGPVRTREGLGVGSTERQVRAVYGDALVASPHEHVMGGRFLTWWAEPGVAGLRFELDASGRVTAVHGGGPEIAYSEGCA